MIGILIILLILGTISGAITSLSLQIAAGIIIAGLILIWLFKPNDDPNLP